MSKIVVGHENQRKFLKQINLNDFYQSWIFYGQKGIGKHTTLLSFINDKVSKDNKLQKIYELSCDNNSSVDDIRELIKFTALTNSQDDEKNFIVIDNADLLNFNSFNALLKTLEEPPLGSIIIMIVENLKKLPKTIISRCNLLKFNGLTNEELLNFSQKNNLNIDKEFLIKNDYLIKGRVDRLLTILSEEKIYFVRKTNEFFGKKLFDIQVFENIYLTISKDDECLSLVIDIIYFRIKKLLIQNFHEYEFTKHAFKLLKFLKEIFNDNNQLDLRNYFLIVFLEYFKLKTK